MSTYYDKTNPLPAHMSDLSPMMVNTLLECGWHEDTIAWVLRNADRRNDHVDWSEATLDEVDDHYSKLFLDIVIEQVRALDAKS